MGSYQIWPCHVTQAENLSFPYIKSYCSLNFWKSHQISWFYCIPNGSYKEDNLKEGRTLFPPCGIGLIGVISEAIRCNLIEQFIIAQPSRGSGGAPSPQVGPAQHHVGGPGSEAPRNLRNLAFSGFKMETKNIFIGINGDNPIWLMRTEKDWPLKAFLSDASDLIQFFP